ncbi:MAG: hypothetical protein P1P76_00555 [Anaerolineales bacterium]|nr:hypothetical protein [Anaerolineales bacterium]
MDNEQIIKKLEWLDEQRKNEAEAVQRLRAHINGLGGSIASVSKQMEDLSGEVSRLAATAGRISQFDEALSKHRAEISRQLEDAENRRTKKEKQIESLRTNDHRKVVKSVDELRRELARLDAIKDILVQQSEEDQRLNRGLGELISRFSETETLLEDCTLRLVSLEEANAQESKRINEVQTDLTGIKRKVEDLRNMIDSTDDRTRKFEVSIGELKSSDKERSDQLETWTDEQRMKLVDFEKRWSDWENRFDAFEVVATNVEEKIIAYDQTHRAIKQMQGQLEDLLERLERRITEVREMQRLAEDRIKQDWAAFVSDETKKWTTYKLSSEERWKEHQRVHEKLSVAVEKLEALRSEIREDLDLLVERQARRVNELVALTREWVKDQD